MAFRQCFFYFFFDTPEVFFFDTPEVTKIVLPKVLQNFKTPNCTCWPEELNQKGFPRNIEYQTRPKGPLQFFRHCETFFPEKIVPTASPFNFLGVLRQNGFRKKIPKGHLFSYFRDCETFFHFFS